MSQEDSRSVELPADLVDRVEDRLPRTEFESTGAYVATVLEEVLFRVEAETDGEGRAGDGEAVDEDEVEARLRSLGYLDE